MILSTIHTFLVLTYISFYNRRDYKKVRSSSGVERFFGWLKSFRRIQTQYERLASTTYLGFIQLLYNNDTNETFQMSSFLIKPI